MKLDSQSLSFRLKPSLTVGTRQSEKNFEFPESIAYMRSVNDEANIVTKRVISMQGRLAEVKMLTVIEIEDLGPDTSKNSQ